MYSIFTHVKFALFLDVEMKISQKELCTTSTYKLYHTFFENSRNIHFCGENIYSDSSVQSALVAVFSSILWKGAYFRRVFECIGIWLGAGLWQL